MSKPKTKLSACGFCGGLVPAEVIKAFTHNCIQSKIYDILVREAPLGAAGYMTPKHKVELAKAIYSEIFDWKSAKLIEIPIKDDGEHMFIMRVGDTGETLVLYGKYSDLRDSIVSKKIVTYMVIK